MLSTFFERSYRRRENFIGYLFNILRSLIESPFLRKLSNIMNIVGLIYTIIRCNCIYMQINCA